MLVGVVAIIHSSLSSSLEHRRVVVVNNSFDDNDSGCVELVCPVEYDLSPERCCSFLGCDVDRDRCCCFFIFFLELELPPRLRPAADADDDLICRRALLLLSSFLLPRFFVLLCEVAVS